MASVLLMPPVGHATTLRDGDHDGLTTRLEKRHRTSPRRADSDRDRLNDGYEVRRSHTNPRRRDTDRDGLKDGYEVRRSHTNPRRRDTDRDGYSDRLELRIGSDPRSSASPSRVSVRDKTPPETTITSGPLGSVSASDASFSFASSEGNSTFQCRLDSGAWASCSSPKDYSFLSLGAHTFSVRARDAAGNLDKSPATRDWTVTSLLAQLDTTPPDTTITSGPSSTTSTGDASFSFDSTEAGSSFECRLDGAAWGACGSPKNYSALASGSHTFDVRATDAAGNTDTTPATRTWTVQAPVADTTPPDTTITSGPSGTVTTADANFSFSSSESGSSFECRLDGGSWGSCSSPKTYPGLANGSHTFDVRATDAAGNSDTTPATRTWTVGVSTAPSNCSSPPCFDFPANSFNGDSYNHVPSSGADLAVSPDGIAVTGNDWIESAHDVRAYTTDGQPTGPRPGNSSGRFRENGGGPRSVAATNTYIYAVQARNVVRWAKATWLSYGPSGSTYNGTTLSIAGTGELFGVAPCGSDIYVVDPGTSADSVSPDTAQVKVIAGSMTGGVLRQWTAPRARHLACDRQGNVWVLGQRTPGASAHLYRYSPSGSLLASWDVSGEPMDVAADPNADQVLIADNGADQDVERYDYSGNLVGRVGVQGGYLGGSTPGLLGPDRFAGPRGVDVDSAGNVYVIQTLNPGRGTNGWKDGEGGASMILSKLTSGGSEVYRVWGEMGQPGTLSDDGSRYYVADLTYGKDANGNWKPLALNMDGFSGSDPQLAAGAFDFGEGTRNTQEREPGGHRLLAQRSANNDWFRVYRFDGELRRICRSYGGANDWYLADSGDVWKASGQVTRYRLTGWDSAGCPTYDAGTTMPAAPGVSDAYRVAVDGTTVYVEGYNSDCAFETGTDDWKFSGKCLARFNGLPSASGWSTRAWRITLPWNTYPDRPVSMDAQGSRVAVAYLKSPSVNRGYVRLFNAADGSAVASVTAPDSYGPEVGWLDMKTSITLKGGLLSLEGNGEDKTVLVTPP